MMYEAVGRSTNQLEGRLLIFMFSKLKCEARNVVTHNIELGGDSKLLRYLEHVEQKLVILKS